jgi:hypothetical protein
MKASHKIQAIFCVAGTVLMFGASDAWAGYTFTTFDVSTQLGGLLGFTNATGVNNAGQVVGFIGPANNAGASVSPSGSNGYDGFIDNGGTFTQIDVPGAQPQTTEVSGINNSGQITGTFIDSGPGTPHGFVTSGTAYTNPTNYTQLDAPSATVGNSIGITNAFGLNNSGTVVGGTGSVNGLNGFSYNTSSQTFTAVNVSPALAESNSTQAQGVNDAGHIAGYFIGNDGQLHGFIDSAGNFVQLDAPFATVVDTNGTHGGSTYAMGLNNSDDVVGYVYDGLGNIHGFVEDGGVFTEIDVPPGADAFGTDPYGTEVLGINDGGELVGIYNDDAGTHGFIATLNDAPEPASLALLGFGILGLLTVYRGRVVRGC